MNAGAAKSGKPCPRLAAPCFTASAVISVKIDVPNPCSRAAAARVAMLFQPDGQPQDQRCADQRAHRGHQRPVLARPGAADCRAGWGARAAARRSRHRRRRTRLQRRSAARQVAAAGASPSFSMRRASSSRRMARGVDGARLGGQRHHRRVVADAGDVDQAQLQLRRDLRRGAARRSARTSRPCAWRAPPRPRRPGSARRAPGSRRSSSARSPARSIPRATRPGSSTATRCSPYAALERDPAPRRQRRLPVERHQRRGRAADGQRPLRPLLDLGRGLGPVLEHLRRVIVRR